MTKEFRDTRLRSADLALRLMTKTAEHVRDCPRCYDILTERAGKCLEERNAENLAELPPAAWPSSGIESPIDGKRQILEKALDRITLMPSQLWPLLAELYPAFVRCERCSNIDSPLSNKDSICRSALNKRAGIVAFRREHLPKDMPPVCADRIVVKLLGWAAAGQPTQWPYGLRWEVNSVSFGKALAYRLTSLRSLISALTLADLPP